MTGMRPARQQSTAPWQAREWCGARALFEPGVGHMLWLLDVRQWTQGALKPGRGAGASGGAGPSSACDEGAVAGAAMALAASGATDISRTPLTGRPLPRRAPASAPLCVALRSRTASCREAHSVVAQDTRSCPPELDFGMRARPAAYHRRCNL